MQGVPGTYHLRVGGYRVLFNRNDDVLIVTVVDAGNRGDVYLMLGNRKCNLLDG